MLVKKCAGTVAAFCGLLFCFLLSGCVTEEKDAVTGLEFAKDGTILYRIVETFDKEYYSIESLKTMIDEEITQYNANTGGRINLQKIEESDLAEDMVVVEMQYTSYEDYTAFNEVVLFYGTIKDAMNAGYPLDVELINSKGEVLMPTDLQSSSFIERYICIIEEKVQVTFPDKISFYSRECELVNKKSIIANKADGLTYVVF